jgi:hypothetical protein
MHRLACNALRFVCTALHLFRSAQNEAVNAVGEGRIDENGPGQLAKVAKVGVDAPIRGEDLQQASGGDSPERPLREQDRQRTFQPARVQSFVDHERHGEAIAFFAAAA